MNIREAAPPDIPAIARVHVESWKTTYTGLMPQAVIDAQSYERRVTLWTNILARGTQPQGHVLVAEQGEGAAARIVGFINGGPIRDDIPGYTAELYAIYLLQEIQGQQVGMRLTCALASRLVAAGHASLLVWVLSNNPAEQFYQKLGAQFVERKSFDTLGAKLIEVAYGWADLHALARLSSPSQ